MNKIKTLMEELEINSSKMFMIMQGFHLIPWYLPFGAHEIEKFKMVVDHKKD